MRVNRRFCRKQSAQYANDIEKVTKEIHAIIKKEGMETPEKFSPQAMGKIFKKMQLPLPTTAKGNVTTESKFLVAHDKYPIVNRLVVALFDQAERDVF